VTAAEQVLAAVGERAAALAEGDAARLRALLHPGFRWTSHRGEVFDREGYVAANTGGALVWRRQVVAAPDVVVAGEAAVVTGVVRDDVERDGVPATFAMRLTQVWIRDGGGWVCLAGHAGPVLAPETDH
jgi:ketosteroid isomerase-like protein